METVKIRQRGAIDFAGHYDDLCALQNSCPLSMVKAHLPDSVLDVNADRIRYTDYPPILNTLKINRTLSFIGFRSYQHQLNDEPENNELGIKRKPAAIRSHEITLRLAKALRDCLCITASLNTLELQGLMLRDKDLMALSRGIVKNKTMKHLSLEYCPIGDKGLDVVTRGVKNSYSIVTFNVTGCGISPSGCEMLADIVRHQAVQRHNEAWQGSLRYKRPDLDRMSGIRRLTLNANPLVGDQGAKCLSDALKDDLWLKALDLQHCGLTDIGGKHLLEVLKYNTTVVVLDVRHNPMIDKETLKNILEHVMINSNGQDTDYKWIKLESPQDPLKVKAKKRRTKMLSSNGGKKTTIKITNSAGRRRSRSMIANGGSGGRGVGSKPKGIPWRTAMRADRCSGYPPDHHHYGPRTEYESGDESWLYGSPDRDTTLTLDYSDTDDTVSPDKPHVAERGRVATNKQLKVEVERLSRRFQEESNARAKAEERVLELTVENRRLQADLDELNTRKGLLDDDKVLESIEATFKQFHSFLDLLSDAGLGDLITMAGLDQSMMPFASFRSQLEQSMNQTRNTMHDHSQLQRDAAAVRREKIVNGDKHIISSNRLPPPDISIPPPTTGDGAAAGAEVANGNHSIDSDVGMGYPTSNVSSILGQSAIPAVSVHNTQHPSTRGNTQQHSRLYMPSPEYQNLPDPTMNAGFIGDDSAASGGAAGTSRGSDHVLASAGGAGNQFDELYERVLRDAQGALVHSRDDVDIRHIIQQQRDQAAAASAQKVDDDSLNNTSDHSMKSVHSGGAGGGGAGSDHSVQSTGSHRSAQQPPKPTPRTSTKSDLHRHATGRLHDSDKSQPGGGGNTASAAEEYTETFDHSLITETGGIRHDDDDDDEIEEIIEEIST